MMKMKSKKCGSQNCLQIGVLRCATCLYIGYCSRECQKQDWKLRHKKECPKLCDIVQSDFGDECSRVRGFLDFYQQDSENKDRWLDTAAEFTSLLDITAAISADKPEAEILRILFLKSEAYRNILENLPRMHNLVSFEIMESYISRAAVAFDLAETTVRSLGATGPLVSDWLNIIHCGRTLSLSLEAECLERRGRLVEAVSRCKEAVELFESLSSEGFEYWQEFLYRCATLLKAGEQYEDARRILKKLYCDICELEGSGDVYLQSVVTELASVTSALGDLEEAEYYSRSALDTLRALSDATTDLTGVHLCQALLALADILGSKVQAQAVENEAAVYRGCLPEKTFDLAMCLEAEALYEEALLVIRSGSNRSIFDELKSVVALNNLYDQRDSTEDAAVESYRNEISIWKNRHASSIATIAKKLMRVVRFYCMKVCIGRFADQDRSQLGDSKVKLITAKYAALEAIAATMTLTTDDAPGDVVGNSLNLLNMIATCFLEVGILVKEGDMDGYFDCHDVVFAVHDSFWNEWFTVPGGLIESSMEWIYAAPASGSNGSNAKEGGGDDRTIGTIGDSSGDGLTAMLASRCQYLLEASLSLSMGEAMASFYYRNKRREQGDADSLAQSFAGVNLEVVAATDEKGGRVDRADVGGGEIDKLGTTFFRGDKLKPDVVRQCSVGLTGADVGVVDRVENKEEDTVDASKLLSEVMSALEVPTSTIAPSVKRAAVSRFASYAEKAHYLLHEAVRLLQSAEEALSPSDGCSEYSTGINTDAARRSLHMREFERRKNKAMSEYLC